MSGEVAQTEAQLVAQLKASLQAIEDARRALAVQRPKLTVIKGGKP